MPGEKNVKWRNRAHLIYSGRQPIQSSFADPDERADYDNMMMERFTLFKFCTPIPKADRRPDHPHCGKCCARFYLKYGGCMAAPDSGSGAPAQAADVAHGSPPPVPTAWVQDLATLHQLLRAGALSDAEFQAAKAKLLAMVVLLHTALKHFLRGLPIKARLTCIISCIITLYVWHYMTISEVDSQ